MKPIDVSNIADLIFAAGPESPEEALVAVMAEVSRRIVQRQVAGFRVHAVQSPRIESAINLVCDRCGVTRAELMRSRRIARISTARGVACVVLRFALSLSYEDVATRLGLHHTTVMHHMREFRRYPKKYAAAQSIIDQLTAEWRENQIAPTHRVG
jgi:chromosomal replication initiation ATPase DnaA